MAERTAVAWALGGGVAVKGLDSTLVATMRRAAGSRLGRFALVVSAGAVIVGTAASTTAAPKADLAIAVEGTQRFSFLYTPQFDTQNGFSGSCRFRARGEQVIRFATPKALRGAIVRVGGPQFVAEVHALVRGLYRRSIPLGGSEQRTYKVEQLVVPDCANAADVRRQAFHSCGGSAALPPSASVVLGVPDNFKSVQMYNPAQVRFMPTSFASCNVPHVFDLHNNFTSPLISICCIKSFKPEPLVKLPRERVTTRAATTTVTGDVRGCLDPRYSDAYNYRLDDCDHIGPRTSRSTISGDVRIRWQITLKKVP